MSFALEGTANIITRPQCFLAEARNGGGCPLFAVYHVAENNSRIIVANYLLKSIQNRNDA